MWSVLCDNHIVIDFVNTFTLCVNMMFLTYRSQQLFSLLVFNIIFVLVN